MRHEICIYVMDFTLKTRVCWYLCFTKNNIEFIADAATRSMQWARAHMVQNGRYEVNVLLLAPKIKYKKNRTDGINLYGDHDDGLGMVFLKFVTKTTYVDVTQLAPGKNSAVWKYKAIYVMEDTEVGIEKAMKLL